MRVALSIPLPVRITTGPLVASSFDDDALLETLVHRNASELVREARIDARTDDGYSFTIVRAHAASGQRIAAMYRFGAWRGYVLVELGDDCAAEVEAALHTATPDWRGDGEVHCIAELFE